MFRIFQRCLSGQHGISLIATGTLLLFLAIVPFKFIVILFAFSLLAVGICMLNKKEK